MVIPTQTTKQIFGRYFLGHTVSAQTCGRKPWGTKSLEVVCNPHRKSWRINPWRRRGGRFKTNPGSGVISRGIYIWYPHRKWTRLLVGISSWSFLNTLISWCIWSPSLWICFLKTNLLIAQAVSPFQKMYTKHLRLFEKSWTSKSFLTSLRRICFGTLASMFWEAFTNFF